MFRCKSVPADICQQNGQLPKQSKQKARHKLIVRNTAIKIQSHLTAYITDQTTNNSYKQVNLTLDRSQTPEI